MRTKSRYSNVLGYDRSRGGLQPGSRASLMAAQRYIRRGEVKGVDTLLNTVGQVTNAESGTDDIVALNLIAPGSGSFNRIGRKVSLKNIRIRGSFFINPGAVASAQNADVVRMSIIWDKQPSGAAAISWDQVFKFTPQSGTEADSLYASLRYDNMERFVVLRDQFIKVEMTHTSTVVTTSTQNYVPFDVFVDLKGIETTFNAQTATAVVTDISTGCLYVMFRSETAAAQLSQKSMARLRFSDS